MKQQRQEEKASQKASKEAARVLLKLEKERLKIGKEGSRTPSMDWSASRPLAMRRHVPISHPGKPSYGIAPATLIALTADTPLAPRAEDPRSPSGRCVLEEAAEWWNMLENLGVVCRAGSSPHVVLLADSPLAPEHRTPERGNSRLSASAEAHASLLHEPGSPGKPAQHLAGHSPLGHT